MNEANTKWLWDNCPKLYKDMYGDPMKTGLSWGIECGGDGWFEMIKELSLKLEKLINKYIKDYPDDIYIPTAAQVKEKFGSLRFYMSGGTEEMCQLIENAENLSEEICEECGKKGKIGEDCGGWLMTRCDDCWEKINK